MSIHWWVDVRVVAGAGLRGRFCVSPREHRLSNASGGCLGVGLPVPGKGAAGLPACFLMRLRHRAVPPGASEAVLVSRAHQLLGSVLLTSAPRWRKAVWL